jgi:aryl carrier-like protein
LRYMQDNMTGGVGVYQHFPLREAQKLVGKKGGGTGGGLFNTLFIQQRAVERGKGEGMMMMMKSVGGSSAAAAVGYPVCVEAEMTEGDDRGLVWRMACEEGYATREETGRMLRQLDQILQHMVRSPEADVLVFSGERVSICGLPPVEIRDREKVSSSSIRVNGAAEVDDDDDEGWSPLEETIRDVLAEVSGVPAAGIARGNNIYHLGLDSISAIKVGSLLRKRGVVIAFREMLQATSISEMARLVCRARQAPPSSDPAPGGVKGADEFEVPGVIDDLPSTLRELGYDMPAVEDVLPASPMQVHMLSVWQNTQGAVFYPCFTYSLSGQADINTLGKAWKALLDETPILRTVFVATGSRATPILQVVVRPSALAPSRFSPDGTAWTSKTSSTLSQPYCSLHATRSGGHSWTLRLKIHHALYDAVSLPAIMDRLLPSAAPTHHQSITHPSTTGAALSLRSIPRPMSKQGKASGHPTSPVPSLRPYYYPPSPHNRMRTPE